MMNDHPYFINSLTALLEYREEDAEYIIKAIAEVPTWILADHFNTAIQLHHRKHHIYIELLKQIHNEELIKKIAQYNNLTFFYRAINEGLYSLKFAYENMFQCYDDSAILDLYKESDPSRGAELDELYWNYTGITTQERLHSYFTDPIYSLIEADDIDGMKEMISAPSFDEKLIRDHPFSSFYTLSPLKYAASCCSIRCFKFLFLNNLLSESFRGSNKCSTMHAAIIGGNYEIIRLVEESSYFAEPFSGSLCIAALFHKNEIYDWLIDKCPDDRFDSMNAIHAAAKGGNLSLLLELDNIDQLSAYDETPLHCACYHGHRLAAQILVEKGADVNSRSCDATPLFYAVTNSVSVVKYLLESGAKLSDHSLQSDFNEYIQAFQSEIFDLLFPLVDFTKMNIGYSGNINSFIGCRPNFFRRILEKGFNPNYSDEVMSLSLVQAILSQNWREGVQLCLEFGCDICTVQCKNISRCNLMLEMLFEEYQKRGMGYYGLYALDLSTTKYFDRLENQNINASGFQGNTALILAIQKSTVQSVQKLIKKGADPNQANSLGLFPIHVAVMETNEQMVQLLLNHKVDPNVKTPTGQTPLHLIPLNNGHINCQLTKLLVQYGGNPFIANPPGPCPYLLARNDFERKCLTPPKQSIHRNGIFYPRVKTPKEFKKHPNSKKSHVKTKNKSKCTYLSSTMRHCH